MTRTRLALAALFALCFAVGTPTPAQAGTNNGTNNWYWAKACTASGGRMDITNYDIRGSDGTVWQEYHIDADRAGGTGNAPKIYISGNGINNLLSNWNDFYIRMADQSLRYTFKVVFSNGSSCSIYG